MLTFHVQQGSQKVLSNHMGQTGQVDFAVVSLVNDAACPVIQMASSLLTDSGFSESEDSRGEYHSFQWHAFWLL